MDTPATESAAAGRSTNLTYLLLGGVLVVALVFAFSGSSVMPDDWYALFKAVHVSLAVVWVGGGLLLTVLAIRAQRAMDPKEVVMIARQAAFAGEKIFAPAGLVVFLMGIAMMINTNWGWGHFWVTVGLVGYVVTFVTGIAVLSPLAKKIGASAQANGPEHPETIALIERILTIATIDVGVLLIVVLDMVLKPFA